MLVYLGSREWSIECGELQRMTQKQDIIHLIWMMTLRLREGIQCSRVPQLKSAALCWVICLNIWLFMLFPHDELFKRKRHIFHPECLAQ